jgi:hypothetical protein
MQEMDEEDDDENPKDSPSLIKNFVTPGPGSYVNHNLNSSFKK